VLLLNREPGSFAARFGELHGPSICSMGWRVRDAADALGTALARGATRPDVDLTARRLPCPR
jgi:4-hydroxyphenylpyruvate dioxygenase